MESVVSLWLLLAVVWPTSPAAGADAIKLKFDTYSGYFVSNRFEPNSAESFLVLQDQSQFDKVFGVAMVMKDRSHRLSRGAFKSSTVLTVIKRGNGIWEYEVEGVTADRGVVQLRYHATFKKSDSATFACPLIVSIPKDAYKTVQFVDAGKRIKTLDVPKK